MSDTPRTDRAEFCILDCRGETHDVVGRAFARAMERENTELRSLLREALPTIDGDMADAWRTGLKQRISDCLKLPNVQAQR